MKIYKAHWHHRDCGCQLNWHGSKRDAQKAVSEALKDEENGGPSGVDQIEIPTDKSGLIRWLNNNFNTDNG